MDAQATAGPLSALLAGSREEARATARRLLEHDLAELVHATPAVLRNDFGLARRDAERVAAAFALARGIGASRRSPRPSLSSPERVHALLAGRVLGLEQELFCVLLVDGKHRLRRQEIVSLGTLTTSLVHPREVFRPAIREAAAAVIVAHNHPSGDPEPSREDLEVTRRLIEVGELVGIPLLDHVVLGDGAFVSLRERMPFGAAPASARRTAEHGRRDRHRRQRGGLDAQDVRSEPHR